ncbi:efflux RND transporter permease subunit [Paludibacter jiangxiensis]|uniref:Cu(I)/Ag(I) efflux system membrane protein CusA/SilA n=1 Tax=Paludibacter jiangxiensis TaxID=681398 RepID=A0A161L855_9BACT|nr:efflux RND transporter permease subunit [Paludibacter jiangxiensis]GAT63184.1 Cu(I)/Ag(I) efflux system membrane protein CusA/SilA [Paludibacter jiangxiensis]
MNNRIIGFFLRNKLITIILLVIFVVWGIITAPFDWNISFLPRDPVPVDAIPDYGENQQIVATEWMGRSPKDIQDQITYPLTTALMGMPGVKTIRSTSMFGMSFIYIIFKDNVEFYWSRSRVLEKLSSLPPGTLPEGVKPSLGPDATALGQVYWYTLEGRNPKTGKPTGGWDPQELRTLQDYYVKYSLASADGVSEVGSIGGYVKEYQIDLNPDAMKTYGVTVMDVMKAVQNSNLDIGAETMEMNQVEYVIRGLGYVKSLADIEKAVVAVSEDNTPITIKQIGNVTFGPATRRGGLDKNGIEAVGGVVVARYKSNPLEVISNVKKKIAEMEQSLPSKTLPDGTVSKVTVVPFYDRTGLIRETIGTLETALTHEILICIIVIIVLVTNLRASAIISGLLPIAVLMTFIVMRLVGVDANIVALSGIAIAIGVMVDIGIVFTENIVRHLELPENKNLSKKQYDDLILTATTEVAPAIITALLTTIISFLPVFAMEAAEGKLFRPLAFTKTFAIVASMLLGLMVLPTLAKWIFSFKLNTPKLRKIVNGILIVAGLLFSIVWGTWTALALTLVGINNLTAHLWKEPWQRYQKYVNLGIAILFALYYLTEEWLPLGAQNHFALNFIFIILIVGIVLTLLSLMVHYYEPVLRWCLANKMKFLAIPVITLLFGIVIWLGVDRILGFAFDGIEKTGWHIRQSNGWQKATSVFPGIGKEFMPSLNEGSFLLMPTSMPHAGVERNIEYEKQLDRRLASIPEVEISVGKWGRVNSALDPANTQMFENVINYKPEYILDQDGHRRRFKTNSSGAYVLKNNMTYNPEKQGFAVIDTSLLIPAVHGNYFRQWRPQIHKPDDIWQEIVKVTQLPGLTSAPKLQPIETRLVMLSTGMRAPMGIKIYGPDLETIEKTGIAIEQHLKQMPSIEASSVFAERGVAAPYLLINIDREAIARYGLSVKEVQDVIQSAVGGMALSTTVEGRERFPVRVRYARELRSTPEDLKHILVPAMTDGSQIPLGELAKIEYASGPQMIRSENTFLTGYVTFDRKPEFAEVDVVNQADKFLKQQIDAGKLKLGKGVTYQFAGNYEQEIRATKRLSIVIPISLLLIFLILYRQFKTITASCIHFSGVFVAFAGGFILLWLYGQGWFLNFSFAGVNMRDLFQMHPINLSVAVWVGFIALFGLATNDGVIMGTYIHQIFEERKPDSVLAVREAVVEAGKKRVRPAMMTAAVAIIALLPVLTSTGKGADIMVPMAIPTFGGMIIQIMTMYVVPVLQAIWREREVKNSNIHH